MTDDVARDPRLAAIAAAHPRPLLFASLSGAHLYGFASPDSDYDLRGVHVLPLAEVVGLVRGPETIERSRVEHGLDLDLVTHDVAKFARMLAKPNGYVLEQLLSPLVVHASPWHAELRAIGRRCVTRQHVRHYQGFAHGQWKLFASEQPPRIKPLLYVYRVLLTGIRLLRTGEVECDLGRLIEEAGLPRVAELIERKATGSEKEPLGDDAIASHRAGFERLLARLEDAASASPLPDAPPGAEDLHDFLVRVRMASR